ncbi:MAG: aspartate aminotransferase family protein [Ignavibacteriae bacterium]|nr:aspartate aminotransferase family protein [Ignavibacteriota bacterium]NOG97909.1 aspartate aminotransferase family protein [Ignavibacteriota bacterium]
MESFPANIQREKSTTLFEEEKGFIAPGLQTISTLSKIAIEKGEGAIIEDVDGNKYIDFFAGVGVASLGYNHPQYVKYMTEQLSKIHVGSFVSRNRVNLTKLLAENALGNLTRTQFYSSGAEAVEAALRLAKSYTKKTEFLGFWGGFHGKTMGVLGLLGGPFKNNLGPLPVGTFSTPYADCMHCPFKMDFPSCDFHCVKFIKDKIRYETTNNIAAIVVEPIQGTNGNLIPPDGFLRELKKLAKEIGALLIADEMITGFGRTGKMFGCQHDNVVPDIITIGKGFGGGYPITGLMSNDEIINAKPFANPSGSSSSYGGNPLASTAAYITLKSIIDEGLVENSANVGAFMLEKFLAFKDKFSFVGDVRGKGLMVGLELIKNKNSKEKLDKKYTQLIFQECLKKGLIVMGYNPDIRINPPLIITKEQAEEGIKIMEEVFDYVENTITG